MSIPLPDHDYSCGAAFCDDPACNTHGPKDADGELYYWAYKDGDFDEFCPVGNIQSDVAPYMHCTCWYDGDGCCRCHATALTDEEKRELGMED